MPKIAINLFACNPIKFDGEIIHKEEFTIDSETQAKALIDAGSATDVNGYFDEDADFNEAEKGADDSAADNSNIVDIAKAPASNVNKDTPNAERISSLKNAITQLDPTIKSHWDKDKSPALRALNKASGETFLKGERDYVWALINS